MMMVVVMPANRLRQILDIGQLALCEAFVKSVASWLSWVAAVVLPSAGQSRRRLSGSWRFAR